MSETQRWSPDVPEATIAIAGQKLTAGQVAPLFLTKDASPPVTYSGLGKTLKELCGSGQPLWLNVEQWRSIVGFVTGSECYRKQLARYRSRHPFPILEGLQGLLGMLPDNTAPQDFALDLDPLPVAGHSYLCDLSEGYFEAAIDGEKTVLVNGSFLAKTSPQGGEFGDTVLLALEACRDSHGHGTVPGFLYTPIDDESIQSIKGAVKRGETTVQIPQLALAFARPLDRSREFSGDPGALLTRAQQVRTGILRQLARSATEQVLNGAKK